MDYICDPVMINAAVKIVLDFSAQSFFAGTLLGTAFGIALSYLKNSLKNNG